jgi:hypothetical protein
MENPGRTSFDLQANRACSIFPDEYALFSKEHGATDIVCLYDYLFFNAQVFDKGKISCFCNWYCGVNACNGDYALLSLQYPICYIWHFWYR